MAKENNIIVPHGEDEKAYLLLLNSFDAVVQHVNSLPDFEDPRLEPTPLEGGLRNYARPSAKENPLNAWRHKVSPIATCFCMYNPRQLTAVAV